MALLGPYLAGCLLLVAAGAAKAWRPGDLAGGLRRATSIGPGVVRVLAVAECGLGIVAFVRPGAGVAALVAASYLAFAGYVAWLRQRGGPLATCGCFGAIDTPATAGHIVVDLGFAAAAAVVATDGVDGWLPLALSGAPGGGWPLVLASVTMAVLAYGVLSPLARVEGARRRYEVAP